MANGWTLERRQRQSQQIRSWKPWQRSTGPRTAEGKARTAMNGFRGGRRKAERELRKLLRQALAEHLEALARLTPARPRADESDRR